MTELLSCSDSLAAFCDRANQVQALALDTEFMRERTYYPELCLIQAAIPGEIVLIDPLSEVDLKPLAQLMPLGPDKILHACRQDQEVLQAALSRVPQPLFDTQYAAALCGFAPQASYATLVNELCGVSLAKGATRTDWTRRPLSSAQLEYAADDVRYLHDIREQLTERLQRSKRFSWFTEDMQRVATQELDVNDDEVWGRVKGKAQLQGRALAVLQALAAWRERLAKSSNRPRRWVLSDEALLALARAQPTSHQQLQQIKDVPEGVVRKQSDALLECIALAQDGEIPVLDQRMPDKALVKRLQQELRSVAEELQLDASVLATRSDLNALALNGSSERLQQGWRHHVVNQALLAIL
ncbi:MAG: ribonuclease D [Oceanococcus sp.]